MLRSNTLMTAVLKSNYVKNDTFIIWANSPSSSHFYCTLGHKDKHMHLRTSSQSSRITNISAIFTAKKSF